MNRVVQREWLDHLEPQAPEAQHSRRDLHRINFFMGNARFVARALNQRASTKKRLRIAELGAGDGRFALSVLQRLHCSGEIILVDRLETIAGDVPKSVRALGWTFSFARRDVFDWLSSHQRVDAIFCNLFLHHFEGTELQRLLNGIAERTPVFVACEPRRSRMARLASQTIRLIGCNAVTRHDAVISVEAGFTASELSARWPSASQWTVEEKPFGAFSHSFAAEQRRSGPKIT